MGNWFQLMTTFPTKWWAKGRNKVGVWVPISTGFWGWFFWEVILIFNDFSFKGWLMDDFVFGAVGVRRIKDDPQFLGKNTVLAWCSPFCWGNTRGVYHLMSHIHKSNHQKTLKIRGKSGVVDSPISKMRKEGLVFSPGCTHVKIHRSFIDFMSSFLGGWSWKTNHVEAAWKNVVPRIGPLLAAERKKSFQPHHPSPRGWLPRVVEFSKVLTVTHFDLQDDTKDPWRNEEMTVHEVGGGWCHAFF